MQKRDRRTHRRRSRQPISRKTEAHHPLVFCSEENSLERRVVLDFRGLNTDTRKYQVLKQINVLFLKDKALSQTPLFIWFFSMTL